MTMRGGGVRKTAGPVLVGLVLAGLLAMPAAGAHHGHYLLGNTTARTPGPGHPGAPICW